ncbi:MAG: hypothetical protein HQL22_01705 [Candidatus Omnitrophica bacterium]|nr:hypothetical protein [Candidatus Omnitrophota bacterium]
MQIKSIILSISAVLLCGCASMVNTAYSKINFSKEVSEQEAIMIAKKYCFDHRNIGCGGSTSVSDGDKIGGGKIYTGKWVVTFYRVLIATIIEIDKESGQVVDWQYDGM